MEDSTKMGDELKDRNDKIENLRAQINEIHKKNEKYVGGVEEGGGEDGERNTKSERR